MHEHQVAAWLVAGNETAGTEGSDSEDRKTYEVRREKQK